MTMEEEVQDIGGAGGINDARFGYKNCSAIMERKRRRKRKKTIRGGDGEELLLL